MDDTREELERLEKELLSADAILNDTELNQLLQEDIAQPAFDDPEQISDPEDPAIYRNFSNGYGAAEAGSDAIDPALKRKNDRVLISLMATACVLSAGIIGYLAYWLTVFLG